MDGEAELGGALDRYLGLRERTLQVLARDRLRVLPVSQGEAVRSDDFHP